MSKAIVTLAGDLFSNITLALILASESSLDALQPAGPFPPSSCHVIEVTGEALADLELVLVDGEGNAARALLGKPTQDGALEVAVLHPTRLSDGRERLEVLASGNAGLVLHVFVRSPTPARDLEKLIYEPVLLEVRADEGDPQQLFLTIANHWECAHPLGTAPTPSP